MKKNAFLQRLSLAAAPALVLLLGGTVSQALAQPSPVGDWDFYLTGHQKGVAQITFAADSTVTGEQIMVPPKIKNAPGEETTNPRGNTVDPEDPRGNGSGGSTTNVFSYGSADIAGVWGLDFKGKLVGVMTFFSENTTNGVSFKGTFVTGKRMTIRASSKDGSTVYHGVPRGVLPNIAGDYFASGKKAGVFHAEMFTLAPSGPQNRYDLVTRGPDYLGLGYALLTSNKRLGIYYEVGSTNPAVSALTGTFNTNKLTGKVAGVDGTNNISVRVGSP